MTVRMLVAGLLLVFPIAGQPSYRASQAAFIGVNIVDAHSSWGKPESNPSLGDRFGWQSVAMKAAFTSGVILLEEKTPRKWRKRWIIVNYAATAALMGIAIHNYGVPKPK